MSGNNEFLDYVVANPPDADEVVRLLSKAFSEAEPPAVAMALSFGEMKQFLQSIAPTIIPFGLTIICRSDTGQMAGALLTDDFASPPPIDGAGISAKFLPILAMLELLDEQFRNGRTISLGEYLHLFMLGVDAQFSGRGVGQGLVKTCLENGCRKRYRMAITEATGKVSQHIFRKNGFVDRFSVSYVDYKYENEPVFASIRDHEKAILMERLLA